MYKKKENTAGLLYDIHLFMWQGMIDTLPTDENKLE